MPHGYTRRVMTVSGGYFKGERLSGKVLPGGADRQLIRRDGGTQSRVAISDEVVTDYLTEAGLMPYLEALGFHVLAFIQITLATHSPNNAKRFRDLMRRVDEIQEAYSLTGDADYLLRIVVPDVDAYDAVYKRLINRLEFADISSAIAMEEMKYTTAIPTDYLLR